MTLEEIEKLWLEDCQIDKANLSRASLNIPKLHQKYYGVLIREQKVHMKLTEELRSLEHILEQYYGRKLSLEEIDEYGLPPYPDQKIMKPDIPKWVASYKDVITTKQKIGLQICKIDYLKSILREISAMSYQIKNAIDWEKFKNGEY